MYILPLSPIKVLQSVHGALAAYLFRSRSLQVKPRLVDDYECSSLSCMHSRTPLCLAKYPLGLYRSHEDSIHLVDDISEKETVHSEYVNEKMLMYPYL